jgi:hypothetical protein
MSQALSGALMEARPVMLERGWSMVLETMRGALAMFVVSLAVACGGKGDDDGGDAESGADCVCMGNAYIPVCGVDGMTYDASCGVECVEVEIECMNECPCNASTNDSGMASGSGTAAETTAAETTMGVDPCDCPLGAYFPVCGVDGMTYDATCGLECVPVEPLCMGVECPCPEIECGDRLTCGPTEPACTTTSGGASAETSHACDPLPPACDGVVPPTCECAGQPGCECVEGPPGYFQVTCNLP